MIDFSDGSDNLKVGGQARPDANLWYARPPVVSNDLPVARPSIGKMIGARTRLASAAATPRDSSIDFSDLGGRFVPIFPALGNAPAGEPLGGFIRVRASDGRLHDLPRGRLDAARLRDPRLEQNPETGSKAFRRLGQRFYHQAGE
jgi:hypothetical protein